MKAPCMSSKVSVVSAAAGLCLTVFSSEIIGIANPGFENGREMWQFDRGNACVVTDVARSGLRSARIEVKDALVDALYVKRQIPIEGGGCYLAECYVKTENVRKANCRQGSVGAGMIVEWLDRNRKWIGTGQYACGLWGTEDWRKVTCDTLRAPPQAGYAIVFLALRGAGRAWFDDVSFSRLAMSVEKLSPAPDSVLDCNTPRFTWKEIHGARSYSVVFSRTADFSDGVKTYPTDGLMSFRLTDPLAPGTWYWKVTAPGREDIKPWKFVQTAPVDRDCLPPEVLSPGARVLSSDGSFDVVVRDDTFRGVKLTFEGSVAVEGSEAGKGLRRYTFHPPAGGGWAKGLTTADILTEDAAGNKAACVFRLLNAKRPDNHVQLDGEGFYTVGGKRFFPLSIYEVKPKFMAEVRKAGFDNVHLYSWEGSKNDEACRSYLDKCWQADGLRAFIGFDRGRWSGSGLIQGNYDHVAKRVGALADHPGLFCWYLYDEPELMEQFISPAKLRSFRELIKALDPYHPVVLSTWNNAMIGIRDYRPAWDVHWTQAYGMPDDMLKIIERQRVHLVEPCPINVILNCNDGVLQEIRKSGGNPDPDAFARDYAKFRASAVLAIVTGSNGLSWWWYAKDRMDSFPASQSPKGWRDFVKTISELRELRPLVLAENKPVTGETAVGKIRILWWSKKYQGKTWLIAINTSKEPVEAELDVPGFGRVKHSFDGYGVLMLSRK